MSSLLRHLSKLYLRKPKDAPKNLSVTLTPTPTPTPTPTLTPPYLTMCARNKEDGPSTKKDLLLYNPIKEEMITIPDKTLPEEIEDSDLVGMSHGWALFVDKDDSIVRMSNFFLHLSSKSTPKIMTLPPLCPLPFDNKLETVKNVAMSSSPDQEEDCVVAVKFMGCQLSFCVPGRDSEWTNIITPFNYFPNSSLTFSKRDQRFNMIAPGSRFLASYSMYFKKWEQPKYLELRFHNIPKFSQSQWEALDLCAKAEHLVEGPSGECFLVKMYGESVPCVLKDKETIAYTLNRFMVFRQDETMKDGKRNMCYTEDIGDLCIFMADNEPFCVEASSCPGLKPNSIYYQCYGFGVYDLAARTDRHFSDKCNIPGNVYGCPFWIPPMLL